MEPAWILTCAVQSEAVLPTSALLPPGPYVIGEVSAPGTGMDWIWSFEVGFAAIYSMRPFWNRKLPLPNVWSASNAQFAPELSGSTVVVSEAS
jgi:hypothetical protein